MHGEETYKNSLIYIEVNYCSGKMQKAYLTMLEIKLFTNHFIVHFVSIFI